MTNQKNQKFAFALSNSSLIGSGLILATMMIIATAGVIINRDLTKTAKPTESNLTEDTNWKRIENPNVIFFSKIFLDRSKTYIVLPIKFESTTQISWLSLNASESAQPQSFLVTHPVLDNLSWPKIDRGLVHLYQRRPTFKSIDEFVANPPPERVAIEYDIKALDFYNKVDGIPLNEDFNLDTVDYILTTYNNPIKRDGAYYYGNTIDASLGEVNSNDNLSWQINVPTASSSNPFYIGEIHVDYR